MSIFAEITVQTEVLRHCTLCCEVVKINIQKKKRIWSFL